MNPQEPEEFMRKTFKAILLMALLLPVAAHAAAQAPVEWYVNMKYGFSIAYQKGFFLPQGEKADGSGQIFRSKDGKAIASVYGHEGKGASLTSVYNETLLKLPKDGWKIAHKSIRGDAFIIRATKDTLVFYTKVMDNKQASRRLVKFEAIHDASRGESYEQAIYSMADSIKLLHAAPAAR